MRKIIKPYLVSAGENKFIFNIFMHGTQVLKDGEHTGELPGQVVRGPGWKYDKK